MESTVTVVLVYALLAVPVLGQTSPNEPVAIGKIQQGITVDGVIGGREWDGATVVTDFVQRLPEEGAAPTEETVVYLAYSGSALYIGLIAYHRNNERIVATTMKRDDFEQLTKNEQFAIAIDSFNDHRNGYWFSTNPLGIRTDAQFFNEGDIWESNWDGIWHCSSKINEDNWTAEIEIPFATLMFEQAERNVMELIYSGG